ncbi:hemicentin-2-like [Ctenocephalides felis]|uniref:hemicentin-2-like n=1 Tax=Ctenocephalides felis TaxID=7515 RepID=UPI000E6E1576|nr:hemicentin-2-like [Ctenocephalides felis]
MSPLLAIVLLSTLVAPTIGEDEKKSQARREVQSETVSDWKSLWYGTDQNNDHKTAQNLDGHSGNNGGLIIGSYPDEHDHAGGQPTAMMRPQVYTPENYTAHNVTVQLGATAFLHCHVRNVGERGQIAWVRRRDWHILSSGAQTYTNDERFGILHAEGSDLWTLQIKYVQRRDNGTYECQVATSYGVVSHFANLQIVVPEAFILGSGEHHVDVGSIISLVCIIEKSPTPPQYVFWYHNQRMINYDTSRGGITVETDPGPRTQSRLTIRDTVDADSGNYTCAASNTEPASIMVFVSEGDKMAAILRRKTSNGDALVSHWAVLYATMAAILFWR